MTKEIQHEASSGCVHLDIGSCGGEAVGKVIALQAEIEQLRDALRGYDDWVRGCVRFDRDRDAYFAAIVDAGRKALASK